VVRWRSALWCFGSESLSLPACVQDPTQSSLITRLRMPIHTSVPHTTSLSIYPMALLRLGAMVPLLYGVSGPTWRASWQ
jgi:hypothetical protein